MTPPNTVDEAQARAEIDNQLIEAGWVIQHNKRLNLHESLGVTEADKTKTTVTGNAGILVNFNSPPV